MNAPTYGIEKISRAGSVRTALLALATLLSAGMMSVTVAGLALDVAQSALALDPWQGGLDHADPEPEARTHLAFRTAL